MPGSTPLGFPFSALTDAPNDPSITSALATAIDTYLQPFKAPVVGQIQFAGSNALSNAGGAGAFTGLNGWTSATITPTGGMTWSTLGITVAVTGKYMAGGMAALTQGDGTGRRGVAYQVNGATAGGLPGSVLIAGTVFVNCPAPARILPLTAGDTVTLAVYNSSGGTINVTAAELSLHLIR